MNNHSQGIIKNTFDRAPWWVPWLLVFVVVIGWILFQFNSINSVAATNQAARELIRDSVIESCERVNTLRREMNEQTSVLGEFLTTAAQARASAGESEVASRYLELADRLEQLAITDCEEAFPESIQRAGFSPP